MFVGLNSKELYLLIYVAGSCGGSWLSTAGVERAGPASSLTSSSSSCIVGMPPSAPRVRVTWSRSPSRLSSVLPRPFRRRPRGSPDARSATLPPAQQPLLAVAGRPCSPYNARHWYDPGYSRTLPWNSRQRAAARRGTTTTVEEAAGRRQAADTGSDGWRYGQCNGDPGRRTATKPDDRHSMERLDTWISCTDEQADYDRMTDRFSWSLACLQDLENGNESAAGQPLVKHIDQDENDKQILGELINPSLTAVGS